MLEPEDSFPPGSLCVVGVMREQERLSQVEGIGQRGYRKPHDIC